MDVTIRAERSDDHVAIDQVVEAAFGSPEIARLVHEIRSSSFAIPGLSLVAERDGRVVGHVMISHAEVRDDDGRRPIAMLSPLAVAPTEQRRGIGSKLVRAVTARAAELGEPVVVLEGSPAFYGSLGFEAAARHGLALPLPSWAPPEAAQVLRLVADHPVPRGRVVYPPAFDSVSEEPAAMTVATTIVTDRLTLTPLAEQDAAAMVDVLGDERMHGFTGGSPRSLDELQERYRRLVVGHSADRSEWWLNWIVRTTVDGSPVGALQATVAADHSIAEVAWEIGVPWQGRGVASEAAIAVVGWLIDHGVAQISAHIHPDHVASARVAERAGLRPTPETVDGELVWRRSST